MKAELREDFNIESFYQWMEEIDFPIPVCCDEDKDKCSHCESEDAMIEVTYKRKTYTFIERLCVGCYAHPDYQDVKSIFMDEIISIKLI